MPLLLYTSWSYVLSKLLCFNSHASLRLRLFMAASKLWNLDRGYCITLLVYVEIHLYDDTTISLFTTLTFKSCFSQCNSGGFLCYGSEAFSIGFSRVLTEVWKL